MAKIYWEKGDYFSFKEGFGVILGEQALMIKGEGGRIERTIEKGSIPQDAAPYGKGDRVVMPYDVHFALETAIIAVS